MAERTDTTHKIADVLRAFIGKTDKKYFTSAVILAAGSSTRMGDSVSKQFLSVNGLPVVARTVMQFDRSEFINEIIVTVIRIARMEFNEYSSINNSGVLI